MPDNQYLYGSLLVRSVLLRMIMIYKDLYEVPSIKVLEVKTGGVVCQSGGTENYNRIITEDW